MTKDIKQIQEFVRNQCYKARFNLGRPPADADYKIYGNGSLNEIMIAVSHYNGGQWHNRSLMILSEVEARIGDRITWDLFCEFNYQTIETQLAIAKLLGYEDN